MAVAVDRNGGLKLFKRLRRCRLQSYSQLDHTGSKPFHRSASTPCLPFDQDDLSPRIEIVGGCRAARVRSLVAEASIAIGSGVGPLPVSSGLGGAYLLKGQNGENIAVTKPVDEEPFALNNPKGFAGRMLGQPGIKSSVRIGETGIRELAAYLLDHRGFAGVPPSALVKISHVSFHPTHGQSKEAVPFKIASLQRFVEHEFDAGELGPMGFSVGSVHRIGILDVRVLNLDRHAGNMLVKKRVGGGAELVPIDHGLCLPEWVDDPYFEWLHWPQSSLPFSDSELAYISALDPFQDAHLLRSEIPSLRESCLRVLVLCTLFLQRAAASGLCLAAIGNLMSRDLAGARAGADNPSALEALCAQAKASLSGDDNPSSLEALCAQAKPEIERPRTIAVPATRLSSSFSAGFISGMSEEQGRDEDKAPLENLSSGCDLLHKAGLVRSKSSLAQSGNKEAWAVSLGDMSEEQWRLFLESFEGLLPEILERAKFASQKQRLGSSCRF